MDADTAGKMSLLVNGFTQILKLGFNMSGRFVLILVVVIGIGGSVGWWFAAERHNAGTFLDALVNGYLMSASAIGTYKLLQETVLPGLPNMGRPTTKVVAADIDVHAENVNVEEHPFSK